MFCYMGFVGYGWGFILKIQSVLCVFNGINSFETSDGITEKHTSLRPGASLKWETDSGTQNSQIKHFYLSSFKA